MQNTSFPCFNPHFPVIVVPLLYFPSITNIPSDNALTILFLAGKFLKSVDDIIKKEGNYYYKGEY